jgi:hypothetical protein
MKHSLLSKRLGLLVPIVAATFCTLVLLSGSGTNSVGQSTNATTYPHVVASVHRTNLTTTIPTTTLFTPTRNGLYRISPYMVTTVPVSSDTGGWNLYLDWADDAGQEEWQGPIVYANSVVPYAYNIPPSTFTFRANAGTPITYWVQVSGGDASGSTYELFFTVEQLQ